MDNLVQNLRPEDTGEQLSTCQPDDSGEQLSTCQPDMKHTYITWKLHTVETVYSSPM